MRTRTNSNVLKRRGLDSGWFANQCALCGIGPEWNGQPLTLQIDHINGDRLDDSRENLRLLCPNCHTQTPTFGGKAHGGRKLVELDCSICFKKFKRYLSEEFSRRNRDSGPYCSKSCSGKANGANGIKSRYGLVEVKRAAPVSLKCIQCGKDFLRKKAMETFKSKQRKQGPFCSSDCWNAWQAK